MEPWEALDIDDSDLVPSLAQVRSSLSQTLLPCSKRPRHDPKPCSQPQTLDSQSRFEQQPQVQIHTDFTPATSKHLTIPGPAGTIQSAMHRKTLRDQTSKEDFASTQEYLRRAIQEDGNDVEDDDFKQNPWTCGLDFIKRSNLGGAGTSSLGSIKKCRGVHRLPLVVAIVKSCTPNGLGDLTVTLKDLSATIGANIHHKVVTETEFGKDISVGSVLVLHKVAAFSPSASACYLNITLNNVIKVIRKDSGPPLLNMYPASPARVSASVTGMIKNPASVRLGAAERITNEDRNRMLVDGETQSNEHNPVTGGCSQRPIDSRSSQHMFVDVEANSGIENIAANRQTQAEGILPGSVNCGSNASQHNTAAKPVDKVAGATQKLDWTDAQLQELLACCDDW